MQHDFTIQTYQKLLSAFRIRGYRIISVSSFLEESNSKSQSVVSDQRSNERNKLLVLRHDIDASPMKAWEMAVYEHSLGVSGTYYFKINKHIFRPALIQRIAEMGHEIGYHYEDLVKCRGNSRLAIKQFENNLQRFRDIVPVVTICAEGSPLSKFDNRDLWNEFCYRDFGLTGEPYFDIDYNKFLYLTDTGRVWNGQRYNVRDKVDSSFDYNYKSSFDVIRDLTVSDQQYPNGNNYPGSRHTPPPAGTFGKNSMLPEGIHMVVHPQRWHDKPLPWLKELVWQNVKNIGKGLLVRMRG